MMKKTEAFFKSYFNRLNTGTLTAGKRDSVFHEQTEKEEKPVRNLILFLITFITTTLAGAHSGRTPLEIFSSGLPYSLTLLLILLFHEFGHYFAARKFRIRASLPFFIPLPFGPVGTMGAVIKMKSPIPDRRALLYIGAMGPVPGFVVSLAAVVAGIYLSEVKMLPPSNSMMPVFGDSILFSSIVWAIHGSIPPGYDVYLSPYAWAGWLGFLITSLNLMPVGQLDGGHIAYALLGDKQKFFGWGMVGTLTVLSFGFQGWILWLIIILFVLMVAHPFVEKGENLNWREKALGWFCMIVFILTFIPVPVKIL